MLSVPATKAQPAGGRIGLSGAEVAENGSKVSVSFTVEVANDCVANNKTLILAPVITDGKHKVSLPPVIVHGRRAARDFARHAWAAGEKGGNIIYTANGKKVQYTASADSQYWMHGADLVVESIGGGCCSYIPQPAYTLAGNLRLREEAAPEPEPEPAGFIPETLADTLSLSFAFVENVSGFDEQNPFRIYDDEREDALIVYYEKGKSTVDRYFRGNELTLINLSVAVNMIVNAPDSKVEHIIVGGFSSPEGSYNINDRLAFERAVSIKRYLMDTTGIDDDTVLVYNGSVDWRGLRYMMVHSDMPERQQVIDIIDNVPDDGGRSMSQRLREIVKLDGGRVYERLFEEYFPLLRNGAFIKVYYRNL